MIATETRSRLGALRWLASLAAAAWAARDTMQSDLGFEDVTAIVQNHDDAQCCCDLNDHADSPTASSSRSTLGQCKVFSKKKGSECENLGPAWPLWHDYQKVTNKRHGCQIHTNDVEDVIRHYGPPDYCKKTAHVEAGRLLQAQSLTCPGRDAESVVCSYHTVKEGMWSPPANCEQEPIQNFGQAAQEVQCGKDQLCAEFETEEIRIDETKCGEWQQVTCIAAGTKPRMDWVYCHPDYMYYDYNWQPAACVMDDTFLDKFGTFDRTLESAGGNGICQAINSVFTHVVVDEAKEGETRMVDCLPDTWVSGNVNSQVTCSNDGQFYDQSGYGPVCVKGRK
mmetsp:Transcript_13401/g.39158  ORF Transcript_13401/g.39158 Transcript_13401/m.39158 type:complete len:338 (+) Transcript_13401:80-1093(+)|eukprot:CAMPEP_0168396248 /NCGR_PEP_ID=MMETSP0228-20121227/20455_1 /TAXON_ID=133427 /ORGANISM="Protoceratium reticulatum, Strain CCCM 535 (=CCMP 1889)" /LENGTH=337 /DNA_ID=CAMNT_0008409693 /DNA_START=277 /DNA_END=1290 /DNA_ORIENTATION=-